MNIQGALTALITPFANGQVDFARLKANVKFQIAQGIDGLVPTGTTGESPTLSHEEHRQVIEVVIEAVRAGRPSRASGSADRRMPVVAGTGSNATSEALDLTQHAANVGADASLQVVPYYNKPTQEGLYRHFMAIADGVDLPLILYNVPSRCGVAMTPATVARLAKHPNIIGIKEATGVLDNSSEIACLVSGGPRKFIILSGDDSLTLPIMSVGGCGIISVLSNLIPQSIKALTVAALAGDYTKAAKLHRQLFPLFRGMFIESNPIPIKTAMALAGRDTGELRLPLCAMSADNRAVLKQVMRRSGLIG